MSAWTTGHALLWGAAYGRLPYTDATSFISQRRLALNGSVLEGVVDILGWKLFRLHAYCEPWL